MLRLFTIGHTRKPASIFFAALRSAGIRVVVDTRLNPTSQLTGYAKKNDLSFFLREMGPIAYRHETLLAPTKELLNAYRSMRLDWHGYESAFLELMRERKVEERFRPEDFDRACLLCSEATPHHCHRRLVAEYLGDRWGNVDIVHL